MTPGVKRILLVEPEPVLAEITAFRLELLGYFVETVASAEDASPKLSESEFDLLITNLELPGLSGMNLIERVSSNEETSSLPIIVLSWNADLDNVQAVHNAGARDFLVVPFQPEVLEQKVLTQLAAASRRKQAKKAGATH